MQVREAEREHDKRANPTPPCPDQNILHHLSSLVHSARRLAVLCSTWRIMQNRSCSSQHPFLPLRAPMITYFSISPHLAIGSGRPVLQNNGKTAAVPAPIPTPTTVWWQHKPQKRRIESLQTKKPSSCDFS